MADRLDISKLLDSHIEKVNLLSKHLSDVLKGLQESKKIISELTSE